MEAEQKRRIEEIMAGMQCSKGFERCKDGLGNLCKAKDRGVPGYVDCLENGVLCEFRLPYGDGAFCKCGVRVYIAKELHM
jgi:hypothetical protein